MEKTKYLFISKYSTDKVDALHPADEHLPRSEREVKRYRCQFRNAVFQTNNERMAEALRAHPHFGKVFFEDTKGREVTSRYNPDEQRLIDHWQQEKIQKLKSRAFDLELKPWGELKAMTKPDLLDLFLQKKGQLEPSDFPENYHAAI
jgi:hypothetical protein